MDSITEYQRIRSLNIHLKKDILPTAPVLNNRLGLKELQNQTDFISRIILFITSYKFASWEVLTLLYPTWDLVSLYVVFGFKFVEIVYCVYRFC